MKSLKGIGLLILSNILIYLTLSITLRIIQDFDSVQGSIQKCPGKCSLHDPNLFSRCPGYSRLQENRLGWCRNVLLFRQIRRCRIDPIRI